MPEDDGSRKCLVRGARFDCAYLEDLTTVGTQRTGHTNIFDWFGLHAQDTHKPQRSVPGLQIDGYFLDDTSTTARTPGNYYGNEKYDYDSQFVMRFPNEWNGKLVITGAPGVRGQYANDVIISDFVLEQGYAFVSTDKGNSGLQFYRDNETPGAGVAEWHRRVRQLTEAARDAAEKYYGEEPVRTYMTGTSNGGYLTRYALEKHPDLYDGGVDWQGVLWIDPDGPDADPDKGPGLFTFLPPAVNYYPEYRDLKSRAARDAIIRAGFEPGSEFLWQYHYETYWNSVQRIFREEFDPYYLSADADYNFMKRINPPPQALPLVQQQAREIKKALKNVSLTGDIGKPLITLHGTLDALLPITKTSGRYAELIEQAGKSHLHRYYRIEGGNHVDGLYDYPDPKNPDPEFREKLRPILPCYRASFDALVRWVEEDSDPPPSQSVPKPEDGDVVNTCPQLER